MSQTSSSRTSTIWTSWCSIPSGSMMTIGNSLSISSKKSSAWTSSKPATSTRASTSWSSNCKRGGMSSSRRLLRSISPRRTRSWARTKYWTRTRTRSPVLRWSTANCSNSSKRIRMRRYWHGSTTYRNSSVDPLKLLSALPSARALTRTMWELTRHSNLSI